MFSVCLVASSDDHWLKQWSFLLSNYQPEKIYIIGEIGRHLRPFVDYISIATAEEIDQDIVLMSPLNGMVYQGQESITDFNHPADCCYMFGSDNVTICKDHFGSRDPDYLVYIPTDTRDDMYSFIAGAVTFYDRGLKVGKPNHRQ